MNMKEREPNGTYWLQRFEQEQAARRKAETMVRDLCMDHPDDCTCQYCKAVFRPTENTPDREFGSNE